MSISEQAAQHGLHPVGVRPKFGEYIKAIIKRREFITVLASSKAQAENQNTYLGQIWAILTPLLNSMVYVLIFGILLKTRDGMDNVIGYIVVGTFIYGFFSSTVTSSAKSISGNLKLVQSLQFPRAILPISIAMKEMFVLLPGLVIMMVISQIAIGVIQGSEAIHPERWLLLIPALVMLFLFSSGVGMILARYASRIPDINNTLPFILRIGMYASGVIFSIDRWVEHPVLQAIMSYQPVAVFLNLARQAVLAESNIPLDWSKWALGLGWALVFFIIGFVTFWKDEARYGRE
ncbi:ABC transporter permease [Jonesia quinghaiensis]|uniref:ABC transporter permease n=1 Tax=Jonesia quinghaiensis TaxID=262806 RepID=UPI000402AEFB|nr:ABC transporter permease [Jonesia quinghaiensis]